MSNNDKAVQKWADPAMWSAEPIAAEAISGPKVSLLSMNSDPLGDIAAACKMYQGHPVYNLEEITDDDRREALEQIQKTKLKAPFEFVKFHFFIEGVTRSFTHQMVRQRTAVYAQESLRFAVKEEMPVGLPPSLLGTEDTRTDEHLEMTAFDRDRMSAAQKLRYKWDQAVEDIHEAYMDLVNSGMPAEDARGLLPHSVLTRLHYATDLRALQEHAGNRLCTMAQFEWRAVWIEIVQAIANYVPPGSDGSNAWQFKELSQLFRPACYLTGKCEFKANFDRSCSIRDRVDANESVGRHSEEWSSDKTEDGKVLIPAIHTREWLLDPYAAMKGKGTNE